jgi:hypothetical protein
LIAVHFHHLRDHRQAPYATRNRASPALWIKVGTKVLERPYLGVYSVGMKCG